MGTRFVKSAVAVGREVEQAMRQHAEQVQALAVQVQQGTAGPNDLALAVDKFAGALAVLFADLAITVSAVANEVGVVGLAAGPGGHYPQRGDETVLDDF